jgi:hypothetical protein
VSAFVEPASRLPLRWGTYRERYLAGLSLLVAGAICMQGTSTYAIFPLGLGTLAHLLGWGILPAAGWRRIGVLLPSLISCVALLAGPVYAAALAVPLLCWLWVRQRPVVTMLVAVPVLLLGLAIPAVTTDYDAILPVLAVMGAAVVGAAWFARSVAASRLFPRQHRAPTA